MTRIGSGDGYLKTVCDYVHLNPARAGLIHIEESVERLSVEQLCGVFEAAQATTGLAEDRSAAGRIGRWKRGGWRRGCGRRVKRVRRK